LIDVVNSQAARPEPLAATLSAALDSIARESILSAVNQLRAFQYQVRAQVPPEDAGLAQSLIGQAQRLIVLLSGGCSNERPAARIAKVARESDGKLRVRIDAPAGVPCILQASTDLVHWENVGVARELAEGDVLAEDCGKATASARFYRLVLP
jgi:hypothetical protein